MVPRERDGRNGTSRDATPRPAKRNDDDGDRSSGTKNGDVSGKKSPPKQSRDGSAAQKETNRGANAARVPGIKTPEVLRNDGPLAKRLAQAAHMEGVNPVLVEKLREDRKTLRERFCQAAKALDVFRKTTKEICDGVLNSCPASDPMLDFCLRMSLDLKISKAVEDKASTAYAERRDDYRQALGDFIPADFEARIEERKYVSNTNVTALGDWSAFRARLATRREQRLGVTTGLTSLDESIGGLRGVTLLAGPTGAGKTSLALNIAVDALRADPDRGVVFFELEMEKDWIFLRLLSRESGVDYRTFISSEYSAKIRAAVEAGESRLKTEILPRLRVVDCLENTEGGEQTLSLMKQIVSEFLRESGVQRLLIIVDTLQKMEIDNAVVRYSDDRDPEAHVTYLTEPEADLARLQLLMNLQTWTRSPDDPDGWPVLALVRLRKTEIGRRLVLADILGSASITFDAEAVLLMEPVSEPGTDPAVTPTLLNIAKVRDGGQRGDVRLDFCHETSTFRAPTGKAEKLPRTGPNPVEIPERSGPKKMRFAGKPVT